MPHRSGGNRDATEAPAGSPYAFQPGATRSADRI